MLRQPLAVSTTVARNCDDRRTGVLTGYARIKAAGGVVAQTESALNLVNYLHNFSCTKYPAIVFPGHLGHNANLSQVLYYSRSIHCAYVIPSRRIGNRRDWPFNQT